ncbi:MAG: hypothetical protein ABL883_14610 [Terricaulis sp.]
MAGGLSRALNAPGGMTLAQACELAAVNVAFVREKAIVAMDDALLDLARLCAVGPPTLEHRRELHALSCTIAGVGGMFELEALSKAAHCFCSLLDETEPNWDGDAVAVHLAAMRILLAPEQTPAAAQESLLEGLAKVRRRSAPRPD